MVLTGTVAGSPAERSDELQGCVGQRLVKVNHVKVSTLEDVRDVVAGSEWGGEFLELCFSHADAGRQDPVAGGVGAAVTSPSNDVRDVIRHAMRGIIRRTKNDQVSEEEIVEETQQMATEVCAKWQITEERFEEIAGEIAEELGKEDEGGGGAADAAPLPPPPLPAEQ
eukprot:gene5433-21353_t